MQSENKIKQKNKLKKRKKYKLHQTANKITEQRITIIIND